MKIAWYSNAPWAPTGYGTQTAQVTKRLAAAGHDVAILANYGLMGAPQTHEGMLVLPGGISAYSTEIADFHARLHFHGEPGLVIGLYDTWPLLESGHDPFKGFDAAFWTPVDHDPVPPKVAEWCRGHETIAMSRFGHERLAAVGVHSTYIPHAIEPVFRPTESGMREAMAVPPDAHLTMVNAANIGVYPPRKSWAPMLLAWGAFARKHEDAYIYIHSQLQHPRGLDLASLIMLWGLPQDRVRIVDQSAYSAGIVGQDDLAKLYTATAKRGVLLSPSMGEGFGLAVIEAQACGLPVIISDFSSQPELLAAGWKVNGSRDEWDYGQGSFLFRPDIPSIIDALERSYATTEDLRPAAIAKAREYDADLVFESYWKPYLASWQERLTPRKGMSNAAKRRARKAA